MFAVQWFQLDSSSYFCYRTLAFPCAFCKTDDLHTAHRSLSHRTYAVSMSWNLQWPLTCCSTGRWLAAETFLKCPHEESAPPSTQQIPHSHAAAAYVRQGRQEGSLYRFPVVAYFTYTLKESRSKDREMWRAQDYILLQRGRANSNNQSPDGVRGRGGGKITVTKRETQG